MIHPVTHEQNGALLVKLDIGDNQREVYYVHRLVAEAFLFRPLDGRFVVHKNGDMRDNHYTNLKWVPNLKRPSWVI